MKKRRAAERQQNNLLLSVEQELAGYKNLLQQHQEKTKRDNQHFRKRLAGRDREIRRLKHALKRSDHQVETVASDQAERTRQALDQLAVANTKVSTIKNNWTQQRAKALSEVDQLRGQLTTLTGQYRDLVQRHQDLMTLAEKSQPDKQAMQKIVRQWNVLCQRLYRSTNGRGQTDTDKSILATWVAVRNAGRK